MPPWPGGPWRRGAGCYDNHNHNHNHNHRETDMSNMVFGLAMARIANSECGLAVFKSDKPYSVNVVFADTVETQRLVRLGDPSYLGTFDKDSDKVELNALLRKNTKKRHEEA